MEYFQSHLAFSGVIFEGDSGGQRHLLLNGIHFSCESPHLTNNIHTENGVQTDQGLSGVKLLPVSFFYAFLFMY